MFFFNIESVIDNNSEWYKKEHYLQTSFWAEFKSMHGWNSKRFKVDISQKDTNFSTTSYVSVLTRRIAKFFTIAYIPLGLSFQNVEINNIDYLYCLSEFAKVLKPFLPKNTICIRFDPPIEFSTPEERDLFIKNNLSTKNIFNIHKSTVNIQPPDTTILDLSKSNEDLLASMKSKWRYNINLAEKKGVEIIDLNAKDIDIFYDLYLQTAKRDGIAIHSKKYYQDLLTLSEKNTSTTQPKIHLYCAKHENDFLASIITLFTPFEAVYVYGASSNIKRNLMPAYLLQWNAIKQAKEFGSLQYDFYGMPPTDDEKHPMHGLYRFKTGFGGKNIHRVGSLDVSISKIYDLYRFAEVLRSFWFKTIKKRLSGR